MKKFLVIAFFISFLFNINAQKIKFKKDQVLLDGKLIANFEGKSSAFGGTDITFKSLDGTPLFTFKSAEQKYFLPSNPVVTFYEIDTYAPKKKIKYLTDNTFYSKKKIVEIMFLDQDPAIILDNKIVPEAYEKFVEKHDATQKLKDDSIKAAEHVDYLIKLLASYDFERDEKKPVEFKYINSKQHAVTNISTYKIIQDSIAIGWVEKEITKTNTSETKIIKVYKRLNVQYDINGEKTNSILAAILEVDSFPKLWIIYDKKIIDTKIDDEKKLVEYLLSNDYI